MGMYTEIVVAIELKRHDLPERKVIDALRAMAAAPDEDEEPNELPDAPFFRCPRWRWLATCDSYYFAGDSHSTFRFDEIAKTWFLTIRSNLKNYNDEIGCFLDWIAPYSEPRNVKDDGTYFVGYWRYEEDRDPTLIYFTTDGKVVR